MRSSSNHMTSVRCGANPTCGVWLLPARPLSAKCFVKNEPQMTHDEMVILTAKKEIANKCKYIAQATSTSGAELIQDKVKQCHDVLDWFEQKCKEPSAPLWVKELEASGSVDDMYATLLLLKTLDEKKGKGLPLPHPSQPSPANSLTNDPKARDLLVKLFQRFDSDHDGLLTWLEFNRALQLLGDDMSEEQLELISGALDLHGSVTLDNFLAIIDQAEGMRIHSDLQFLSHFTHKHPSDIDHVGST